MKIPYAFGKFYDLQFLKLKQNFWLVGAMKLDRGVHN